MGCWAFGILQSDDSLDWEATLYDVAGIDAGEDDFNPESPGVRAGLEAALPKMLGKIQADTQLDSDYDLFHKAVGYQMLAYVLMQSGCSIPEETRRAILSGILACSEYNLAKKLMKKGDGQITEEMVKAAAEAGRLEEDVPGGWAEWVDRLTGRYGAISRLAKEFGEYDASGGTPHQYRDQGALELFGSREMPAWAATLNSNKS